MCHHLKNTKSVMYFLIKVLVIIHMPLTLDSRSTMSQWQKMKETGIRPTKSSKLL